jgi:hypothetical protein
MTAPQGKPSAVAFEGVNPILRVEDLTAAVDPYVRVLGFELDWQGLGSFASVSRGRCHLFLCRGDQGHPVHGFGLEWKTLTRCWRSTGARVRRSTSPRTILGPTKCRLKIWTPTCCVLGRSQRKTNRKVNGWTCMAGAGFPCLRAALNAWAEGPEHQGTGPRSNAYRAEV